MIHRPNKKYQALKKQQGMTFLEVLVAFVIITVGVLGSVAMQATAKQSSFDAMQRSLASSLAQDIIARMRANSAINIVNYIAADYGVAFDAGDEPASRCTLSTAVCTPAEIVTNDIYEWELSLVGGDVISSGKNAGGLVGGQGCVLQNGNRLTVVVSWQGKKGIKDNIKVDECGTSGSKRRQVVVQTFII